MILIIILTIAIIIAYIANNSKQKDIEKLEYELEDLRGIINADRDRVDLIELNIKISFDNVNKSIKKLKNKE